MPRTRVDLAGHPSLHRHALVAVQVAHALKHLRAARSSGAQGVARLVGQGFCRQMAKQGRRLRGEQTVQRARHCIGADRAAQVQPLLQAHNAHLDALVVLRQLLQAGVAHLARHRRQPLRQQLLAASKQDVVNFSNNQQLGRQPLCQLLLTVAVRLLAI